MREHSMFDQLAGLFTACVPSTYVVPTYNIVEEKFEIMPRDIPAQFDHLWGAFDECMTEISAKHIVHYCQAQGSWKPFTSGQIQHFYQKRVKDPGTFTFNRLIEPGTIRDSRGVRMGGGGWIVRKNGRYYVTDDFIRRVYRSLVKD